MYLTIGVYFAKPMDGGGVQTSRFSIVAARIRWTIGFEPQGHVNFGPMPHLRVRSREDFGCSHVSHMTQGWGVSPQRAPTGVLTGVRMRVSGAFLHSRTDLRRRPATPSRDGKVFGVRECNMCGLTAHSSELW